MLSVSFRALEIRSCILDFRLSLKPDVMEELNEFDWLANTVTNDEVNIEEIINITMIQYKRAIMLTILFEFVPYYFLATNSLD